MSGRLEKYGRRARCWPGCESCRIGQRRSSDRSSVAVGTFVGLESPERHGWTLGDSEWARVPAWRATATARPPNTPPCSRSSLGTCIRLACRGISGGIPARFLGGSTFRSRWLRPLGRIQRFPSIKVVRLLIGFRPPDMAKTIIESAKRHLRCLSAFHLSPRRSGNLSGRHPTRGSIP